MKINLSQKLKNVFLILIFISICFICDVDFFGSLVLISFPYFTCDFEHSLGYYLYQTSEIYRIMYNNREITTCVLGCLYFLFFRCYVFQKWVSIIENKCKGLFLHDFLIELRKNKQILLYANIILLLLTIVTFDLCRSALKINYICSFIFVFPFHYLILYIRWAIKDKNFIIKSNITAKYHITQYINYIFFANFIMIAPSSFWIFLSLFSDIYFINKLLCVILCLLALFYCVYYTCYFIKQNIKLFFIVYSSVFVYIYLLIYTLLNKSYEKYFNTLVTPLITILELFFIIGIISSLFINQIAKLLIEKQVDTSSDLSE